MNFAVYAEAASALTLCIFSPAWELQQKIPMVASDNVWHISVSGLTPDFLYCFELERAENKTRLMVSDPYARNLNTLTQWRRNKGAPVPLAGCSAHEISWGRDLPPRIAWSNTVIYEAHVKGFTMLFPGLPEHLRGKYLGLSHPSVVSWLKNLGVTTLELLPVQAKSEDPFLLAKGLHNYWGYNTFGYFAPEPEYAYRDAVTEFRTMVRELHRAGIEVILDVVYNHTGEGGAGAPPFSFRGLAEDAYYLRDASGKYLDYSHCGNTLRAEHPVTRNLILDSLRYWASEMHVDGFRFDLAPALFRVDGHVTWESELHREILNDPVLKTRKLIVEPWDLGPDGYAGGKFPWPYVEWDDDFRDKARLFWKGEKAAGELAHKLFYREGREAINYITCHDGFSLMDLVSYEKKRNEFNGENNKDGSEHNHSFNCGAEGETTDAQVISLRRKMRKNLMATLLFAGNVPMLLAGDEFGNTQGGNNNAYCQDNVISWLNWAKQDQEMVYFIRNCLGLRKSILTGRNPGLLHAQNVPEQAFGLAWDHHYLLFNAAKQNALFALNGMMVKEVFHTDRNCHNEYFQDIYLMSAQSVALLTRHSH